MSISKADVDDNSQLYAASLATPIGKVGLYATADFFYKLKFLPSEMELIAPSSPSVAKIVEELCCYFRDPNFRFSIPLEIHGTTLQRAIWQALCAIPVGTTLTYGALAKQLNTSPRVVGNACRANSFPIIIPCHRVVGVAGLGGYAGEIAADGSDNSCGGSSSGESMLAKKRWLLQHEGAM